MNEIESSREARECLESSVLCDDLIGLRGAEAVSEGGELAMAFRFSFKKQEYMV